MADVVYLLAALAAFGLCLLAVRGIDSRINR